MKEGKCFFKFFFSGVFWGFGDFFMIALVGSLKASRSSSLEFPALNVIFPRHKK